MLLAVDEIMDMARTTVNVVGNGLASVVIARWEGVFGMKDAAVSDAVPLPAALPIPDAEAGISSRVST